MFVNRIRHEPRLILSLWPLYQNIQKSHFRKLRNVGPSMLMLNMTTQLPYFLSSKQSDNTSHHVHSREFATRDLAAKERLQGS